MSFDFVNTSREKKVIHFGEGALVKDSEIEQINTGSTLDGIHTLNAETRVSINILKSNSSLAQLCLWPGKYRAQQHTIDGDSQEFFITIEEELLACLEVVLPASFMVFSSAVDVMGRQDTNDLVVYPDVLGNLKIRGTTKVLELVSGMEFSLTLQDEKPVVIDLEDGMLRMQTIRTVEVSKRQGDDFTSIFYTPLDILQHHMKDNSLWYSVSLLIGAIMTLRKVLELR